MLQWQNRFGLIIEYDQPNLVALAEAEGCLINCFFRQLDFAALGTARFFHTAAPVDDHHEAEVGLLRGVQRVEAYR